MTTTTTTTPLTDLLEHANDWASYADCHGEDHPTARQWACEIVRDLLTWADTCETVRSLLTWEDTTR